jgi:hypothetical protein
VWSDGEDDVRHCDGSTELAQVLPAPAPREEAEIVRTALLLADQRPELRAALESRLRALHDESGCVLLPFLSPTHESHERFLAQCRLLATIDAFCRYRVRHGAEFEARVRQRAAEDATLDIGFLLPDGPEHAWYTCRLERAQRKLTLDDSQ